MSKYCEVCGKKLTLKEDKNEGPAPYCKKCREFRYPKYNVGVSMVTISEETGKILLIKQYHLPKYVLVAGYVDKTEALEHAVVRELKEETNLTVTKVQFNKSKYFKRSDTLMCNFAAWVKDESELKLNEEVDKAVWFTEEEARKKIYDHSLAEEFLLHYLDNT